MSDNTVSTASIVLETTEAMNNFVGVEPFKTNTVEKKTTNAFAVAQQKVDLTPLKVVHGTENIPTGATVYVRGDLCAEPDGKKVYEIDGVKFILIPVTEVKVVRKPVQSNWWLNQSLAPTPYYFPIYPEQPSVPYPWSTPPVVCRNKE